MTATKSLCEFYGGQFFRKMIHSFLNLIYSPSARLASAMQIVTELCLTDTCKFFQTSKREYPGIFQIHFTVNRHCRNFIAGYRQNPLRAQYSVGSAIPFSISQL